MRGPGRPGTAGRASTAARLTRAILEVLHALLLGFHNSRDARCFPSYETIALRAQRCRNTVYEAIKVADILTWVNRLIRMQHALAANYIG